MRLTSPAPSTPALSTSAVSTRSLRTLALTALLACGATPMAGALAASPPAKARTTQEILDASQPSDWRALDPARTLYMELASGRVIIERFQKVSGIQPVLSCSCGRGSGQ